MFPSFNRSVRRSWIALQSPNRGRREKKKTFKSRKGDKKMIYSARALLGCHLHWQFYAFFFSFALIYLSFRSVNKIENYNFMSGFFLFKINDKW